ncbi:MAG: hypothetical protein ACRD2T_12025 [Thermoanaerobaculia bacterium]
MRAVLPVLALALLGAAPVATPEPGLRVRFERANRTYRDLAPEIATFQEGDLSLRLSSPRNAVAVRDHFLRLEPGAGGSHAAELTLTFEGSGWLVADVTMGGVTRRLEDEVRMPRQTKTLEGRAKVARVEGGYRITPEQLPRQVEVAVRSGVGDSLLDLCASMALMPALAVDCSGVEKAVRTLVVALPEPGESLLLPEGTLTREERRLLDDYLRRTS